MPSLLSPRESDGYAVGHPWYRRMQADKTPASGQASPLLNHPEETACRLIRRRSAGSGNCDQARLAVTDHAMAHGRAVVLARARPGVLTKHSMPARRAQLRDSRVPRVSSTD